MVFVHSFQPEPMLQSKFRSLDKGLKITLVNHAYSVECIHKFGHTIELYTTSLGAELLKPIPYDKVHIVTNDITNNWHFAASIKFKALQNMSLDQCLIDGDIFLEKTPVFEILKHLNKDVVVSLYEPTARIFKPETMSEMFKACEDFIQPGYELPEITNVLGWYNTSLLKFNNAEAKEEYIKQYITHVKFAESIDFSKTIWPDIVFEQCNLESMVKNMGYEIDMVNPYYNIDDAFAYKIGFCHLGVAKEISQTYYLRMLQTLNFQLSLDIQEHFIYLMEIRFPQLNIKTTNNT